MNNQRRKAISEQVSIIRSAQDEIETIMGQEQDAFDSMPENMQDGERGQASQTALDELESARDGFDDIVSSLDEASA